MATTTVKVADHMSVIFRGLTATQTGWGTPPRSLNSAGTSELNSTQHVSMVGANSVALSVTLHATSFAAAGSGSLGVEVVLEQSNDRSNWFEVDPSSRSSFPGSGQQHAIDTVGQTISLSFSNKVTMAWVRVTFLITSYGAALAANDFGVVSCDLTASLL